MSCTSLCLRLAATKRVGAGAAFVRRSMWSLNGFAARCGSSLLFWLWRMPMPDSSWAGRPLLLVSFLASCCVLPSVSTLPLPPCPHARFFALLRPIDRLRQFVGSFADNKFHGQGQYTDQKKVVWEGTFHNGKFKSRKSYMLLS